jgi:drug/metabolite transporter (DMT)-like permease
MLDVGGLVLYSAAASTGPLGLTSVVASLYPVVTVVLAYVLLKERLAPRQRLGAAAALLGTALMSS